MTLRGVITPASLGVMTPSRTAVDRKWRHERNVKLLERIAYDRERLAGVYAAITRTEAEAVESERLATAHHAEAERLSTCLTPIPDRARRYWAAHHRAIWAQHQANGAKERMERQCRSRDTILARIAENEAAL